MDTDPKPILFILEPHTADQRARIYDDMLLRSLRHKQKLIEQLAGRTPRPASDDPDNLTYAQIKHLATGADTPDSKAAE